MMSMAHQTGKEERMKRYAPVLTHDAPRATANQRTNAQRATRHADRTQSAIARTDWATLTRVSVELADGTLEHVGYVPTTRGGRPGYDAAGNLIGPACRLNVHGVIDGRQLRTRKLAARNTMDAEFAAIAAAKRARKSMTAGTAAYNATGKE